MNDAQLFRLILLGGFVILLPIGVFHRLKSRTGEKLDRRQEGLFILVTLRLCGIAGMLGVFAYLLNPAWLAWAALPLPTWLRWTGAGFGVISEVLFVWTLRHLGKNLTDTVVTRRHHTLVTTGPYHWIRHPFYTAAALMIPASFLMAANWFFLAIGVAVLLLLAIRTRKEEENLIARFGDEYRNYMRRTGRFLPRSLPPVGLICGVLLSVAVGHYLINRLFAGRNAVSVRMFQTPGIGPDTRFDGTLKFAAFNIAHGRGTNEANLSHRAERRARLKAIAELLQRHEVDIAVLNEVDFAAFWTGHENQAEIIAREARFAYRLEQRNFDAALPFLRLRFGNAILSRFPIKASRFVPLPAFSDLERRIAGSKQGVLADIQVDDQLTIRAFAVHLEPRDELTRIRSAAAIAACATNSPYPFFCLGDFNCSPASAEIPSTSREPSPMDRLIENGGLKTVPATRLTPELFTFASYAPTTAIDWVLVPMDWEFISHEVQDVQLSDHRPVLAEVRK